MIQIDEQSNNPKGFWEEQTKEKRKLIDILLDLTFYGGILIMIMGIIFFFNNYL